MQAANTDDLSIDLTPVAEIVAKYAPFEESSIISALQDVQDRYGYLPQPAMDELAGLGGVPVARLYGVATFYSQFYLEPHGKHTIRVCRGTACHVRGAPNVLEAISRHLKIEDGRTTPDMFFSLETVACLGTCFLSPVMVVDSRYFGNLTPDKAVGILKRISAAETNGGESAK